MGLHSLGDDLCVCTCVYVFVCVCQRGAHVYRHALFLVKTNDLHIREGVSCADTDASISVCLPRCE